MRRALIWALLLLGTCWASNALADEAPTAADIKRAAQAYDQGRERFREEQYTEAAEKFETADSYAPSAAALRLAIFARQEAGQIDRALTHAALALEKYPDNAELVSEAQTVIDEDADEFAKVDVSCDDPCELLLNNRIVHGPASTERTLYVSYGTAEIRASWSEGRTQSETMMLGAGDQKTVNFYAPEIPVVTDPSTPEDDFSMNTTDATVDEAKKGGWHPAVFGTSLALTAVGGVTTAILGVRANNNPGPDAVQDKCESGDTSCPEFVEGVRNQNMANVALGITAGLGVFTIISAVLTDWGGKKKDSDAPVDSWSVRGLSIRPTLAVGTGATIGASGTF